MVVANCTAINHVVYYLTRPLHLHLHLCSVSLHRSRFLLIAHQRWRRPTAPTVSLASRARTVPSAVPRRVMVSAEGLAAALSKVPTEPRTAAPARSLRLVSAAMTALKRPASLSTAPPLTPPQLLPPAFSPSSRPLKLEEASFQCLRRRYSIRRQLLPRLRRFSLRRYPLR